MYKVILLGFALSAQIAFAAPPEGDVKIAIVPTSPFVFPGDLTFTDKDGAPTKVYGPWYRMQLTLDNGSEDTVTVVHVNVVTTAPDGAVIQNDFDPVGFNFTLPCEHGVRVPIEYDGFGEFGPHGKGYIQLAYMGPELPRACRAQNPNIETPVFYVGGLPNAQNSAGAPKSTQYHVAVTLEGWFGTRSEPRARFQKTLEFVTQ